ncbi:MAG: hypothetical protein ABIH89_10220 [Elusimicrobiota bacterium]
MCIAQRLLRQICQNCREPYEIEAETLLPYGLKMEDLDNEDTITLHKGTGCEVCGKTGYKGRIACYEIMDVTNDIKDLINKKSAVYQIKQKAIDQGMRTLRDSALSKVLSGQTSIDEMLRVTSRDSG